MKLAKNIEEYLAIKSIKAETVIDGVYALMKIAENYYDVIVLDINLPGKDGLTICRELRVAGNNTPIIMLTSRNASKDVVTGLDAGADDYLGKPFDLDELVSRLEALYRRNSQNKSEIITLGDVEIDVKNRVVTRAGENVSLSTLEFNLLKYLAQNRGTPVDRATLFEKVWGDFDGHMFSRTVDMYVSYVRKKLGEQIIETRKGFGYLIN